MTQIFLKDYWSQAIWIMCCLTGIILLTSFNSNPLFLLVTFVFLYVLGVIVIPETKVFKALVKEKLEADEQERKHNRAKRLDARLNKFSQVDREDALELISLCRQLKEKLTDNVLRTKVDETLDIYFNILDIQENCTEFMKTENVKSIAKKIEINEGRYKLETDSHSRDIIENILKSLRQRLARLEEAEQNVKRVGLEKERLVEQIKLIYAESLSNNDSRMLAIRMENNFRIINQIKIFTNDLGNKLNI